MNVFDQMRTALIDARSTMRAADNCANGMADMLAGRLRHCSSYRLTQLKRELRDFNMHTGKWMR